MSSKLTTRQFPDGGTHEDGALSLVLIHEQLFDRALAARANAQELRAAATEARFRRDEERDRKARQRSGKA